MKLNSYVPGDPGSGRSVARPVSSIALLSLRPHDANTDHDCSLPTTAFVAAMALARCVARWITEGRLRFGVMHSGCCAGPLYMVVISSVNRLIPAGGRTRIVGLKGRCPGRWTTGTYMCSRGASTAGCRAQSLALWGKRRPKRRQEPKRRVEPAVSRLRAWCRCRWTTRACGWEGRIRTASEVTLVRLTAGCLTVRHTSQ